MGLNNEKYVSFTTFRRDGTPVATAVWIVELHDGRLGFTTSPTSGKAKRLAHTSRVTIQASDLRGRVRAGSEVVEGTGAVVTEGPVFDEIAAQVRVKYGLMVGIGRFLTRLVERLRPGRPSDDGAVVITFDP
jgi:hypothetical protein